MIDRYDVKKWNNYQIFLIKVLDKRGIIRCTDNAHIAIFGQWFSDFVDAFEVLPSIKQTITEITKRINIYHIHHTPEPSHSP